MDNLTDQLIKKLSPESQIMLMKDFESKKMSSTVARIMRFFWWHYAYMGQRGKQFIYRATLFGLLVWWIVEAFRLNGKIDKYNDSIMSDLLIKYKLYDKN